ncbi:hypothetical protein TU94_29595 [Streptomyces cyaneogriseus subsp. noncyanogenus]|uniref:Insertion element IS402-like domain-containing protein n=1 Tax=Streptomyces cyaneogriseus subsp. noncyanogenus TaxID=477245 RepID=A0A0C5G4V8_9ACTN|nr:hypothetical protein TU94_29595 [Streptomyces cyaneogriseus subsp. noncyanogenus]
MGEHGQGDVPVPARIASDLVLVQAAFVSDELWNRLEPLLPQRTRRFRYPGRKPLPDREVLCGILYVLQGI